MANKRINKSEAVYDHDCFDNYFYSDPEKENSWALNDLCATIDDCHLEHTGEVDNQDYVECCTTLPDGTEVAVSVGICDDGTGDNDLHELASYNIDVGDNVGPGVIREWDKAYKIDEIPEMWQDLWNDLDKLIAEHSANESLNKGKTMKSESIEDLKDKSVSWGTMRSEDLIPKFLGVLKQYAPDNYDAYVKANPEVLDLKGMDDETLGWVVDELFDELDKIAPEGTYFGAHPDDGADYGFWSVEESKQREAKKSEAYGEREACPKCGSKHIHDLKVSRNGDDLEADIACDDCGHTWYDNYSFSGAYVDGSNKKYYEPITKCPKCGGSNLEVSISDDACEDFKCKDCGTVWYNSFVWDDLHNESFKKPAAEAKKSEGLSIDDYAKYNMDHYAAKAAGWTWDDENSCYVDKDGIVVEWDSSDAVMIDPIEYDGHTYEQVNVWGDGTVEFQDETGVSENWAEFDDELVGKIYAALGGKVGEAYEPRMTPPWGPEDMEYTQAELTGEDVLGDFFLQALQYLRKDLGYSYDLKQERHLLTKLTRLFDKGLDYKKAIDTILSDESFCARTGIRKPAAEAKKPEAYEDIWRGAKVVSYEDAADYITLPAEEEQKIIDKYGKDYYDNPDAMNEYAEALDDYIVAMFDQDFVYIDGDEIPLAVCREPKILIVQTIDHIDGDKAVELVKKLANGELTGSSEDGDFVAIMDGVNGSPHFDIYSEEPKSEGKSDKDGKDDKDCKGKGCDGSDEKCGGDKKKENRGKPQEGPGAGYDVTFEDVDVKDVSVTFNEAKDAFDVALKISARMNAEGYDWDTQYYREHMGYEPEDDEITLKFSLPNSSLKQDWADMDMADASIEEKVKALDEAFHNVDLQKFGYGGGWSHSGFHPGYVDNVLVYPFEYDGAYIEPCQSNSSLLEYNTYIPLEMDVQGTFAQDVEGACNYGSDLYDFTEKVRDIVKDLLPEQEISDSDISDERCEDYFTGGWDAEDAANEIADELRDSSESKKSESKKSEGNYQDWISFAYAMYASRLRTLARKLVSFGFDVEDDVNIKDENKNDKSAEYSLYAKKDGKTYEINVDIYEGKHTTITIKADNKVVVQGEGSSFASALSTIDANDIGESNKSESEKNEGAYLDGSMSNAEFMSKLVDNAPNSLVFNKDNNSSKNTYTISANPDFGKSSRHALIGLNADDDKYEVYTYLYNNDAMTNPRAGKSFVFKVGSDWNTFITAVKELFGFVGDYIKSGSQTESKKSESLTLKQKELKDMVLYGEAEDITGISDAEAKELRKNGIETVGVSRGVYGMNGALLRGSDGKLYAITARSSNLFYFV